jgi:hypothetical protein
VVKDLTRCEVLERRLAPHVLNLDSEVGVVLDSRLAPNVLNLDSEVGVVL